MIVVIMINHYHYYCPWTSSGSTKCATFVNMTPLLRPQSSEGKFNAVSRGIEPVRRSLRRRGSRTLTEVARLAPSGE